MITLGIIGVVAALTLPNLIADHRKKVVEVRLAKFYSSINLAIERAEIDYDDKRFWWDDLPGAEIDKDGNPVPGSSEAEKWFNKYFTPYLEIVETKTLSDGSMIVLFPDGSSLRTKFNTTRDWIYYPGNYEKCMEYYKNDSTPDYGECSFAFNFNPDTNTSAWIYHYQKGMEPWKYSWDGNIQTLKDNCAGTGGVNGGSKHGGVFCTALIQLNGWKIPKDYPHKVWY